MNCCRLNCTLLAVLVGVLAGVLVGVLYAFGLVATGVIFWAYLGIGVLGLLFVCLEDQGSPNKLARNAWKH